ncbi:MAG: SDR family oxidoreductase [Gammaproteobacteria bacterium]|nr:SDR family oxidoreductase [Gammaproteobacteria bacterium]
MAKDESKKKTLPKQHQNVQPGVESQMHPLPESLDPKYRPAGKLKNKVAIITGGDSGIGRAVAIYYALEGAQVAIVYLNEHNDATTTQKLVEQTGQRCLLFSGDISEQSFCKEVVEQTLQAFKRIDILVNNAAEQHVQEKFSDISKAQLEKTFKTNVFAYFFLTQAVLPHLKKDSSIINTASITAYQGHDELIDYAATKGAVVSFTRSLSSHLVKQGIRVNAVAPGPIWTPLIPSTFSAEKVEKFGSNTPMQRPGEPSEVATCYVFLASDDASYLSGQVLHPNGGTIING